MSDFPTDHVKFEHALAELEAIVRELEDGQTGLEEALARYEKGVGLLKRCYGQLREAEQRILLLTGVDAEGRPAARTAAGPAGGETDRPVAKRRRKGEE